MPQRGTWGKYSKGDVPCIFSAAEHHIHHTPAQKLALVTTCFFMGYFKAWQGKEDLFGYS